MRFVAPLVDDDLARFVQTWVGDREDPFSIISELGVRPCLET